MSLEKEKTAKNWRWVKFIVFAIFLIVGCNCLINVLFDFKIDHAFEKPLIFIGIWIILAWQLILVISYFILRHFFSNSSKNKKTNVTLLIGLGIGQMICSILSPVLGDFYYTIGFLIIVGWLFVYGVKQLINMNSKAKVGGILSIGSGLVAILTMIFIARTSIMLHLINNGFINDPSISEMPISFRSQLFASLVPITVFLVIVGVLAIVGGSFAIKKKHYSISLVGAIGSIAAFFPLGIPSLILISKSRSESIEKVNPANQLEP